MKDSIQHDNLIIDTEIAHFAKAYIEYGHDPELLAKMFDKSRATINRWLKRRDFIAEYNKQVGDGVVILQTTCKREAPKSLYSKVALRDKLQAKVDKNVASVYEMRLLNEINNDIIKLITGEKLRMEHSGPDGGPLQVEHGGELINELIQDPELAKRIKARYRRTVIPSVSEE